MRLPRSGKINAFSGTLILETKAPDHRYKFGWRCIRHGVNRRVFLKDLEQDRQCHSPSGAVEKDSRDEELEGLMGKLFLYKAKIWGINWWKG
jgi:hypothetical protein